MGGVQLVSFHQQGPAAAPPSDADPPQPWWFRWMKGVGMAAAAGGAGAACAPTIIFIAVCGGSAGFGAGEVFDWIWGVAHITPKEQADNDAEQHRSMEKDKYCHTYNGCQPR
jgi:hypothetical protein